MNETAAGRLDLVLHTLSEAYRRGCWVACPAGMSTAVAASGGVAPVVPRDPPGSGAAGAAGRQPTSRAPRGSRGS